MKQGLIILLAFCVSSCAFFSWKRAEVYPMSFDQTYELALDALDDVEGWTIVETDFKKGIINMRDNSYFMSQPREMSFQVTRIDPYHTKVALHGHAATPFTQKFFKVIDKQSNERIPTYPT